MRNRLVCAVMPCLILLFPVTLVSAKVASDSVRVHADLPYLKNNKLFLDVLYSGTVGYTATLELQLFRCGNSDSLLVLKKVNVPIRFKKASGKVKIGFAGNDTHAYFNYKFYEVLHRANSVAPGVYKLTLIIKDSTATYRTVCVYQQDTLLHEMSPVRKDINCKMKSPEKFSLFQKKAVLKKGVPAGVAFGNAKNKINKVARKRGLESVQYESLGKTIIDLYFADWLAGRYEVNSKDPLTDQLKKQEKDASLGYGGLTNNEFGSPTLFSQFKTLGQNKSDQEEIRGEIALTTNLSTGQEQYSAVDNNYYEFRGTVELPVLGMPVQLEGF